MKKQWEGEFSRFFVFSQRHSQAVDDVLRPTSNPRRGGKGIWLTSSSMATILISKPSSSDAAVLSISVSGYIHEEHIVSNLHLTWPQISCVPQCPIRGSRVVFMSYSDFSGQIQKFAVRFPESTVAGSFFNFFKDCSTDAIDVCDFVCVSSSASERTVSNALRIKFHEVETAPAFTRYELCRSPSPIVPPGFESSFSGVPPSFTELLTNFSSNSEDEISKQMVEPYQNSEESVPNLSLQSAPAVNSSEFATLEADISNEIARYMSDASFLEMLSKVEKVIHQLGGDLPI